MSTRFINNREVSKTEAYERALSLRRQGKTEDSDVWFSAIDQWQYLPSKKEWEKYKEYRGWK